MFRLFQDLNVLEILRLGLAGLCFLLSLLAFWLINREQQRPGSPRKGILQAIYTFMSANLVTALLVGVAGYLGPQQRKTTTELDAKTYLAENTSFMVDLTKWTEKTLGPVEVTRTDGIRKVSDTPDDYVVPYLTSGDNGITAEFLSHSYLEPQFLPDPQPGDPRKHYIYKVPMVSKPVGDFEMVSSRFTFLNGFKDPEHEWWEASAAYPSKSLSVVVRFANSKPCKKIAVYKIPGIGGREPMTDNQPVLSNGGIIAMWTGLNLEGRSRIHFDWDW
jgi:hypothetical protein